MEVCNGCMSAGVYLVDYDSGDGVKGVEHVGGQGHGEFVWDLVPEFLVRPFLHT